MLKKIQQKQNNLYNGTGTDNNQKVINIREKNNSRSKTKNLAIQTIKNNEDKQFNDLSLNGNCQKLSKVKSYSKGAWPKANKEYKFRPRFKKGKSTTSLKCKVKNNTISQSNLNSKKESNSLTKNISNKKNTNSSRDNILIKKKNLKINNISTPNADNTAFNINTTNTNGTSNEQKTNNPLMPKLATNLGEKYQNVKVFIRFRPSNEVETSLLQNNYGWLVPKFISQNQLGVYTSNSYEYNSPNAEIPKNYIFSYDKVFSPNSNQSEIYNNVGKRIVEDIMAGYNGTIFAYGQSGSGKTYTMYGNDIYDENAKGIIPRVVEEIFKRVEKSDVNIDFQLKLSVVEIYKEVMYDLFTQENNLKIIENKEKGIYIENLTEVYLSSIDEFFNYAELSQKNRKVAETKLNHNSSRSHCIMILEVIQNYKKEKIIKKGILNLVDLAGSEKVSKTGAVGETLEEAKKINLSLSTLGNVIHSLTSGMGHVPYRDSKLTRILKESLGGNYKTYLIVTCSPHSYNLDEIISSLLFAKRVKTIKNKYKINIKYSYEELQNLVDKLNAKLLLANEKIQKLVKGEKINLNEEPNNKDNKEKENNTFICNNCYLLSKEKKIMENKIQELMDSLQEKDNEISKLKEEIQNLNNNKDNKDNKHINNNLSSLHSIKEVNNSINPEEKKTDELFELYTKIKEKLSKIEEENERIKIIQNEEEEIRKINLKKESFNKILKEFIRDKDKLKCFEKMDSITKVSIPYVKDRDYKNLFNEFKNNIQDIFAESFIKNNNNIPPSKLLDIINTNLFFEYLRFYFSQQIINQGYLKLILDNNSLHKMNKYLFDIIRDILSENFDIANENVINANAINCLRASMVDSFISKQGGNNNLNIMNDLKQKIVKVVSKRNLNLKNSLRMNNINSFNSINNGIHENNNNPSFAGSIQGYDLKNSIGGFNNENYAVYINKLKSQEYEKSSNKIQMIRNVLVSIIKETDYIRNDVKELKENLNKTIKNIMNYFSKQVFKNDLIDLDIKDCSIYENRENGLQNKHNIDSYNNYMEINNLNKNENINQVIKIIPNKKNKIRIDNQTYDNSSENINPNISKNYTLNNNEIKKTNCSAYINLTSNPSSSNIRADKLNGSNSNNNIKKNCLFSKLIKQKENQNINIQNTSGNYLDNGRKLSPVPKKLNQAKGDIIENANYFILTQQ